MLGQFLLLDGQETPGELLQPIPRLQSDQRRQALPLQHTYIQLPQIALQRENALFRALQQTDPITLRAIGLEAQRHQRLALR
ncbi:hypothetical protein D3C84_1248620 [compost metagenome]